MGPRLNTPPGLRLAHSAEAVEQVTREARNTGLFHRVLVAGARGRLATIRPSLPIICRMCAGSSGSGGHDGGEPDRSAIGLMSRAHCPSRPRRRGRLQDGRVAFGHRRLSIIDLTEASSQFHAHAGWHRRARLQRRNHNHRELRRDLEREGVQFQLGRHRGSPPGAPPLVPERSVARLNGSLSPISTRADARCGFLPVTGSASSRLSWPIPASSSLLRRKPSAALLAHPCMARHADRYLLAKWLLSEGRGSENAVRGVEPRSLWKVTPSGIEKRRYFALIHCR